MLVIAALLLSTASTVAPKVIDGVWFDGAGDQVPLSDPPEKWTALVAGSHSARELVAFFDDACLKTGFTADAPAPAVSARAWGFEKLDGDIGARRGEHLIGWQAADVSVSASHRVWPLSECIVSGKTAAKPELAAVTATLNDRLGLTADRQYPSRVTAFRSFPVNGTTTRWRYSGKSTHRRTVYAAIITDGAAYRLNLAVTEETTG